MAGNQAAFAAGVLKGIGAPVTSQNIAGIIGWAQAEGGWSHNNPLNTTQSAPGASNFNSVGVKTYPNLQVGVQATVQTLRNGRYGNIISTLRSGNVHGLAGAIGSSPWGTSGQLAAQTIGRTLRQPISVPSGTSGGLAPMPPANSGTGAQTTQLPTFNQAGFQKAQRAYVAGNFLSHQAGPYDTGGSGSNPLFSSGLLTTTAPNPQDFQGTKTVQVAQSNLQRLAGGNVLNAHPQLQAAGKGLSNIAGGFLPKGAQYIVGRKDQGRDGQTNPGGPIIAPGNGVVLSVKSNPGGFGPSYPLIHWTSGRYAGRTTYIGHTLSTVKPGQRVSAGQVISRTGTTGIGNATVPGWFEIGFADSGSPGPMGQAVPF